MNARQLLLGLLILVPAVCGAKPHNPFINEQIRVPLVLCEFDGSRVRITNRDGSFEKSVTNEICYNLDYRSGRGLVFVWVDTLQGAFFGFSMPQDLLYYHNELPEAFKDLRKQLDQYPGALYIKSSGGFIKYPEKLNQ